MTNGRPVPRPIGERCDVVILGGGPAGLATAIELRQASELDVVVVEAHDAPSERYGESLPPDIVLSLDRLGVSGAFRADGHLPCPGSVSLWGSERPGYNDFILNPLGPGWHISRSRFEAMLRTRAVGCGASLLTNARAVDAARTGDGFGLTVQQPDGRRRALHARWVVDATGWPAWFARRQGAARREVDRKVAIVRFATIRSGSFSAQTVVEATPDGWWYCAALPDDRLSTVFVAAPRAARVLLRNDLAGWRERLAGTQLIASRLADCDLADERVRAFAAPSGILDDVEGDRWLAVGDAAAAYDPIASRGIHSALADARASVSTILGELGHAVAPRRSYGQHVEERFQDYLAGRKQLYTQEQRWARQPFWRAATAQSELNTGPSRSPSAR